jgi:hypothetical protein
MAINFPDSPNVNDTFSSGTNTWKWDGTTWSVVRAPYVLSVTSPITNSGTSESPNIGVNQTLVNIAQSQVTGLETALSGKTTETYVNTAITSNNKVTYATASSSTAYTLDAADVYKIKEFTSASAVTITIPDDATDALFPIGSSVELRQMGDGRLTIQATSPATLTSPDSYTKTRTKYSSAILEKRDSNTWILTGDIDA